MLRLRYVTSYDVYADVRSRTAPRRSRSPRWRCSASPSTETGGAGRSLVAGALDAGPAPASPEGAGPGRTLGEPAADTEDSSPDAALDPSEPQPARKSAPTASTVTVQIRARIGLPPLQPAHTGATSLR